MTGIQVRQMTAKDDSHVTTFLLPIPLREAVDDRILKIETAAMTKIDRSEFFREAIWFYLDYLEKQGTEEKMIEILTDKFDPWAGEKKNRTTFRETVALLGALDNIIYYVYEKTGEKITKSSIFLKSFNWYLTELKNRATDKMIAGLIAEGKQ